MYYPICFLMPNAGPCVKAAAHQPAAIAGANETHAPVVPTPTPTALSPAESSELSSVSKYKAMLRSIYSSRQSQSSLSEFWATAVPTSTGSPSSETKRSKKKKVDEEEEAGIEEDKQVDTSPMSVPKLMWVNVAAAAAGAVAWLII